MNQRLNKEVVYIKAIKEVFDNVEYYDFKNDFIFDYIFNSNKIENNNLSKKDIIELMNNKKIKKNTDLIQIFETYNHFRAFNYVLENALFKRDLSEVMVKDIHQILMENIINGGIYRKEEVYISGSDVPLKSGDEMYNQLKDFFEKIKTITSPIKLAAYTHAEFVRIHPFIDGNGRLSRLLMNYQLIKNDLLPIVIDSNDKKLYFNSLEEYSKEGNIRPIENLILINEKLQVNKLIDFENKKIKKR